MGWDEVYMKLSNDQILAECGVTPEMVVAKAARLNTIYVAVRSPALREPDGTPTVFALVVLVRRGRNKTAFKDIDESMGPWECDAPLKVIDALTTPANPAAAKWRENCRKNAVRKAAERQEAKAARKGNVSVCR